MKNKKCKACREEFTPERSMQQSCSVRCALTVAQIRRKKLQQRAEAIRRAEDRQRREALKTIPDLLREAQTACNAYIRERDKDKPCISCGSPPGEQTRGGSYDAGHYRSRGAAGHLRFDERNIHGQCKKCNRYLGGNSVGMRFGMVKRLGVEVVEALEKDNRHHKWHREELIDLKEMFKRKLKELKALNGANQRRA